MNVSTTPPIIITEHLSHRFKDGTDALKEISLTIDQGAFVVLCGANGSGKTTLLKHFNGLMRPTAGAVRVEGVRLGRNTRKARQTVGLVFQNADAQIVGETVAVDVAFGPENLKLNRDIVDQRVDEALHMTGLTHYSQKPPHTLSGGEKRRLAIAGVLAMQPKVLLLDEPFANLDWPSTRQVLSQLIDLHRQGTTIVVATHDIEKIVAHANRLIVLNQGSIALDGEPVSTARQVEQYGVRVPCALQMGADITPWVDG